MATAFAKADIDGHGNYESPAFVQERLAFKLEIRCTIVDDDVYCASIEPDAIGVDIKNSILAGKRFRRATMSGSDQKSMLKMMSRLGLRYAAVDLGVTDRDELYFLEVNPSGMYQNVEADTSLPVTESIAKALARNDAY